MQYTKLNMCLNLYPSYYIYLLYSYSSLFLLYSYFILVGGKNYQQFFYCLGYLEINSTSYFSCFEHFADCYKPLVS